MLQDLGSHTPWHDTACNQRSPSFNIVLECRFRMQARVCIQFSIGRNAASVKPLGTSPDSGCFTHAVWMHTSAGAANFSKKLFTLLDLCVSSLRRGHANLLCIVPILTDDPRRESTHSEKSGYFSLLPVLSQHITGFV